MENIVCELPLWTSVNNWLPVVELYSIVQVKCMCLRLLLMGKTCIILAQVTCPMAHQILRSDYSQPYSLRLFNWRTKTEPGTFCIQSATEWCSAEQRKWGFASNLQLSDLASGWRDWLPFPYVTNTTTAIQLPCFSILCFCEEWRWSRFQGNMQYSIDATFIVMLRRV